MNEQGSPDWSYLPHDPRSFFGLGDEFDRKTLKRAYNRLIKQYKPERHPAEFQKIREAYEVLDAELRYGRSTQSAQISISLDWNETTEPTPPDPSRPGRTPEADPKQAEAKPQLSPVEKIERLFAKHGAEKLYRHLEKSETKRPLDYYVLALLSDEVTKQPLLFVQWLLTGLREHPDDPALFRLMHMYFKTRVAVEDAPKLLLATAKVINDDRFYFLTEKLWDDLLRKLEFEKFAQLLAKCESQFHDFRIEAKIAFYIHIMRAAIWTAPQPWQDRVMVFLNENHQYVSPDLEYELEITQFVQEFIAQDRELPDNPIRKRIRAAIKDFCTLDQVAADVSIIKLQSYIANNASEVLNAFPSKDDDAISSLRLWSWIADDAQERSGLATPELPSFADFELRVLGVFQDLDEKENTWTWVLLHYGRFLAHGIATVCCLFGPIYFLAPLLGATGVTGQILMTCGLLLAIGYWLKLKDWTVSAFFEKQIERTLHKAYHQRWRPAIQRLISATHIPHEALLEVMVQVVTKRDDQLGVSTWIPSFYYRDAGLWLFSLAQRSLR